MKYGVSLISSSIRGPLSAQALQGPQHLYTVDVLATMYVIYSISRGLPDIGRHIYMQRTLSSEIYKILLCILTMFRSLISKDAFQLDTSGVSVREQIAQTTRAGHLNALVVMFRWPVATSSRPKRKEGRNTQ
jgi:hypothetical protein